MREDRSNCAAELLLVCPVCWSQVVDEIGFNAKPEDVREILEEAAGTLIYKQRKAEASRKLENTRLKKKMIFILTDMENTIFPRQVQLSKRSMTNDIFCSARVINCEEVNTIIVNCAFSQMMTGK